MAPIRSNKDVLDNLYEHVSPSIVSVNTIPNKNYSLDFATGFIVYSDNSQTFVCVDKSLIDVKEELYVHFSDGVIEKAKLLIKSIISGHTVLVTKSTTGQSRRPVSFSPRATEREEVFTIQEVEGGYNALHMVTGTVIAPSCKALDEKAGKIIKGSDRIFAMSCEAISWPHIESHKKQLIGAAVFNLDGLLTGTIKTLDKEAFDLKFSLQANYWFQHLQRLLQAKNKKYSLSRDRKVSLKIASRPSEEGAENVPRESGDADNIPSSSRVNKRARMREVFMGRTLRLP